LSDYKMQTAIILLNYNGWQDTVACIDSINCVKDDIVSVIVVDNCSTNDSYEQINRYISDNYARLHYSQYLTIDYNELGDAVNTLNLPFICLVKSGHNGGFAYGNNVGIKVARRLYNFEYFWMLNSDTLLTSDALTPMLNKINADKNIGIVGSVLIYMDPQNTIQALGGVHFHRHLARGDQIANGLKISQLDRFNEANINLDYIAGASMLVRASFLDSVGLMSEGYFLYYEELDWAFRAKRKGYSLAVALDSHVLHKEGASIGTSSKETRSLLSEYYLSRNILICYKLFIPFYLPIAVVRNIVNCIKLLKTKDFGRIKVILRATLDGLVGRGRDRCVHLSAKKN
jgi:GT2 family glycosyltransferase